MLNEAANLLVKNQQRIATLESAVDKKPAVKRGRVCRKPMTREEVLAHLHSASQRPLRIELNPDVPVSRDERMMPLWRQKHNIMTVMNNSLRVYGRDYRFWWDDPTDADRTKISWGG